MGKPIDSRALAILKKLNLDQKNEQGEYKALWDCHGTWVMYHRYIEQAGAENDIKYHYQEIETDSANGIVVVKCTAELNKDGKSIFVTSYGESSPKNTKNSYPYAMAEKRAYDRCVLKLLGLHGFVYSEDEMPEEKLQKGRASSKLDSNIKIVNVKELKKNDK